MIENKHDEKRRKEIGIQDIDKYDFGGFEIDEQLTNGYHLYVPYGIHTDFFKAIHNSIQLLYKERSECENSIRQLNDTLTAENKCKNIIEVSIQVQKDTIARVDSNLKILEKFVELENEI